MGFRAVLCSVSIVFLTKITKMTFENKMKQQTLLNPYILGF
jgi:hypothetical protein